MSFKQKLKKRLKLHYYSYPSHFTHVNRNWRYSKLNKFNTAACFVSTSDNHVRHYVTNQIMRHSYFEAMINVIFDIKWQLNMSCAKIIYHNNSLIFSDGFLGEYSSFTATIFRPSYLLEGKKFYKDNYSSAIKILALLKETQ